MVTKMISDVRDLPDNDERAVELFVNGLIHDTDDDVELITLSQILKTAGKDTTWEPKTKTTKKCHRIQRILYDGGDAARYADEKKQQEIRAAVDSFKIDFDQIEKIENITKNAEQITDVDINTLMDAIDFNTTDQLTK